jgi:hypothetical protein
MYCVELLDDYVKPYIVLLNISVLCILFRSLPTREAAKIGFI